MGSMLDGSRRRSGSSSKHTTFRGSSITRYRAARTADHESNHRYQQARTALPGRRTTATNSGYLPRGEATGSSDVDFLVEFEPGRTLLDLAGLRLDLCDALGREVDVATQGSLHPGLRERILREVVPVL